MIKKFFSKKPMDVVAFDYLLYQPEKPRKKLPLIVFLHGAGERGDNLDFIKCNGLPFELEQGLNLNCYAVMPQCKNDTFWVACISELKVFIDGIIEEYDIDEDRVYLSGISMGGYGAWYMAMAYPDMFAGLVPVCGGGMLWNASVLKDTPIWAFHGDLDTVVNVEESVKMVSAVNNTGGNAKLTIYSDTDHDSWVQAFKTPELYEWLLGQKRHK